MGRSARDHFEMKSVFNRLSINDVKRVCNKVATQDYLTALDQTGQNYADRFAAIIEQGYIHHTIHTARPHEQGDENPHVVSLRTPEGAVWTGRRPQPP